MGRSARSPLGIGGATRAETGRLGASLAPPKANYDLEPYTTRDYQGTIYEARSMGEGRNSSKAWLTRQEAAAYLTELGFPIAAKTLANMASNENAGGGPVFTRSGWRTVRYRHEALEEWSRRRIVDVE